MNRKFAGILIGVGAGLGLGWLLRRSMGDAPASIEVETGSDGRPRVAFVTPDVSVKQHKHVRWHVDNRSNHDVVVALRDWQDLSHRPVTPAVDADPDDHEQPPQNGLERLVPAGKKRPIRGRARGPQHGMEETVKYAVYLDNALAVDPIVKLVL